MEDLESEILRILCTGLGEGNTNTTKITEQIIKSNPDTDLSFNQAKIKVVETLENLKARGKIQIVTVNWEMGEEFFYICTNRL